MLNHNYIGTEHLLLGLIHEGGGVAARALESLGVSLQAVRQQVEEIIGHGQNGTAGRIPFTPRAKKVLELSRREALAMGHNYVGTEHILLGLLKVPDSRGAQILAQLGLTYQDAYAELTRMLEAFMAARQAAQEAAEPEPEPPAEGD